MSDLAEQDYGSIRRRCVQPSVIGKRRMARTEKRATVSPEYLVDYDEQERITGVEILNIKKALELTAGRMSPFVPEAEALPAATE